jgi:uncharacterized membrane protein
MIWDRVRNSLWGVPIAIVIVAGAAAVVAVQLKLPSRSDPVWWLYSGDAAAASGFLANLLTAMITMATLAISITMVVLTLAAQSLGPRLIPIFMGDARTKLALGIFLGTTVYLLIALRTVVGATDSVPNLAITVGTALVLTSIVVLLFFVHHLARSIVADTIIRRVGEALDQSIHRLLPQKQDEAPMPPQDWQPIRDTGRHIRADATGYIQAIDHEAAVAEAKKADATVALNCRPGHFVLRDEILGWGTPPEVIDDDTAAALASAIVCGPDRTPYQDLEYSIRQLVEIALRALSPGVNDPFTACAVLDRITASIEIIMRSGSPQSIWRDDEDAVRLLVPASDFDGIVDAAFNQIRQAGARQPAILIRLVDRLGQLLDHADTVQSDALTRHIDLALATGLANLVDEADRVVLSERVTAIVNRRGEGRARP